MWRQLLVGELIVPQLLIVNLNSLAVACNRLRLLRILLLLELAGHCLRVPVAMGLLIYLTSLLLLQIREITIWEAAWLIFLILLLFTVFSILRTFWLFSNF